MELISCTYVFLNSTHRQPDANVQLLNTYFSIAKVVVLITWSLLLQQIEYEQGLPTRSGEGQTHTFIGAHKINKCMDNVNNINMNRVNDNILKLYNIIDKINDKR